MFLSGIGLSFGSSEIYKRKRISAFKIDEILFRSEINISGYGFVLNQFTNQYLESISQKKEYVCNRKFS
jgi:hypothetical protein